MKLLDQLPYKVVKIWLVMSTRGNIKSYCVFTFNLGAELCADLGGGSFFFSSSIFCSLLGNLTQGIGHAKNQLLLTYTGSLVLFCFSFS